MGSEVDIAVFINFSLIYFSDKAFHWTWSSQIELCWLTSELQETSDLYPFPPPNTEMYTTILNIYKYYNYIISSIPPSNLIRLKFMTFS